MIKMLKQSVRLVSLVWAFGLFSSPQMSLASKPTVLPNNSYNSVAKPTERRRAGEAREAGGEENISPDIRSQAPVLKQTKERKICVLLRSTRDEGSWSQAPRSIRRVNSPCFSSPPNPKRGRGVTPASPALLRDSFYNSVTQPTRLVISLSRRQVTLYKGKNRIKSYRIAVGRRGWETPTGNFLVGQMLQNPTWIHPFTGEAIPGGDPDNPLGHYWIGFWSDGKNSIGFHGTPNPESVGRRASHGCIRMYNQDVEELFHQVKVGTLVKVVH